MSLNKDEYKHKLNLENPSLLACLQSKWLYASQLLFKTNYSKNKFFILQESNKNIFARGLQIEQNISLIFQEY